MKKIIIITLITHISTLQAANQSPPAFNKSKSFDNPPTVPPRPDHLKLQQSKVHSKSTSTLYIKKNKGLNPIIPTPKIPSQQNKPMPYKRGHARKRSFSENWSKSPNWTHGSLLSRHRSSSDIKNNNQNNQTDETKALKEHIAMQKTMIKMLKQDSSKTTKTIRTLENALDLLSSQNETLIKERDQLCNQNKKLRSRLTAETELQDKIVEAAQLADGATALFLNMENNIPLQRLNEIQKLLENLPINNDDQKACPTALLQKNNNSSSIIHKTSDTKKYKRKMTVSLNKITSPRKQKHKN